MKLSLIYERQLIYQEGFSNTHMPGAEFIQLKQRKGEPEIIFVCEEKSNFYKVAGTVPEQYSYAGNATGSSDK